MHAFKVRLWDLLEITDDASTGGPVFDWYDRSAAVLIVLNVVAVVLESVDAIGQSYARAFAAFEVLSVVIFSLEYLGRVWTCTVDPRYARPLLGRMRFAMTPMALIDVAAVLPFFMAMAAVDLRFMRAMRLFRLMRVLKFGRYSSSLALVGRLLKRKRHDLMAAVTILSVLLVMASSAMYYLEREAQPDTFASIPAAMWWGIATFTTVGYGDVYPVTAAGKVLGALTSIIGIGVFALPAGILAAGFAEERDRLRSSRSRAACPHCGMPLD